MTENKDIVDKLSKDELLIINEYNNALKVGILKNSVLVDDNTVKKVKVVVNDVVDKDGNVVYYSAKCSFYGYDKNKLLYTKNLSLEDNNIETVKQAIREELPYFNGEIDFTVNSVSRGKGR